MNHRKWKQVLTLLIILCMVLPTKVVNAATTATSISLSKTEGDSVKVKSSSGKEVKARKNMNLYSGYGVETGKESYVYLLLDKEKAVKLDQNTQISIKKEGRKNEINLETGELFFDVKKPLESGETVRIRTSNCIMGIRGTSGVVKAKTVRSSKGLFQGRKYTYQIFDGKGFLEVGVGNQETRTYEILPGRQTVICENTEGKVTIKEEVIPKDQISSFAIKEMIKDGQLGARVENGLQVDKNELVELDKVNEEKELEQYRMQEEEVEKQQEIAESNQTILYMGQESMIVTPMDTPIATDTPTATVDPSPSDSPSTSVTPYPFILGEDANIDTSVLNELFSRDGKTMVEIRTQQVGMEYSLTNELLIPTGCKLILGENVDITTSNLVKNEGKIEITEHAKLKVKGNTFNQGEMKVEGRLVNVDGGDFTNLGTIELVVDKALQNGTMLDDEPKVPEQYAILVNHGDITGKIVTTKSSYINCWEGKNLAIDYQGGIFIGDVTVDGSVLQKESIYGMLEFIASDGIYYHQLKPDVESLEWNMLDAEYGGDIDIYGSDVTQRLADHKLVIHQNSSLPEVVLKSPNGYYYGCPKETAINILSNACKYNELSLNQDFIVSEEYDQLVFQFHFLEATDDPVFIFNLNHHTLDLRKTTVQLDDNDYHIKYMGQGEEASPSSYEDNIVRLEGEKSASGGLTKIINSEFDHVTLDLSGEIQLEDDIECKGCMLNLRGKLEIPEGGTLTLLNPKINLYEGTMLVNGGVAKFSADENADDTIEIHTRTAVDDEIKHGIYVNSGELQILSNLKITKHIDQSMYTIYGYGWMTCLGDEMKSIKIEAYKDAIVFLDNGDGSSQWNCEVIPKDSVKIIYID